MFSSANVGIIASKAAGGIPLPPGIPDDTIEITNFFVLNSFNCNVSLNDYANGGAEITPTTQFTNYSTTIRENDTLEQILGGTPNVKIWAYAEWDSSTLMNNSMSFGFRTLSGQSGTVTNNNPSGASSSVLEVTAVQGLDYNRYPFVTVASQRTSGSSPEMDSSRILFVGYQLI